MKQDQFVATSTQRRHVPNYEFRVLPEIRHRNNQATLAQEVHQMRERFAEVGPRHTSLSLIDRMHDSHHLPLPRRRSNEISNLIVEYDQARSVSLQMREVDDRGRQE